MDTTEYLGGTVISTGLVKSTLHTEVVPDCLFTTVTPGNYFELQGAR